LRCWHSHAKGKFRKLGGTEAPALHAQLSQEQREAALLILNSRDTVTGLTGNAGTGKTRMMQATVKAIEAAGTSVFAFAPSAKATQLLRDEGFGSAETVEKLLTDPSLHAAINGHLLWIDEAGPLSTRDMKRLFDLAKEQGARDVLSGDAKQHSSVVRGDGLRLLERDAGIQFAQLQEVRRQTNAAYRDAVTAISNGELRATDGRTMLEHGIQALDHIGAIVEVEGEARYRHIAADYIATTFDLKKGGEHKTALVVSPTHAEAAKVTEAIRDGLKKAGRLGEQERDFPSLRALHLTEAQRGSAGSYKPGDVIQVMQNAKSYARGERMTVIRGWLRRRERKWSDGRMEPLTLAQASRFQVYEAQSVALAQGDRLRITRNGFTGETRAGGRECEEPPE
jgi:ATP-dependent exoDNAse (exonuclease V) alpha subunit